MTAYLTYDVFTQQRFGGNQLAVIPDARAIPEGDLQQIAREFNYSETTFVYPPDDPAHTAKVRIFTPTTEVDFAGHPTIGTAIALRDQGHNGDMVLELGVGPIPCSFNGDTASFVTRAPLERLCSPDVSLVADALGLCPNAIDTSLHRPVQASLGLPFVIVALDSADSLAACAPNLNTIRQGAKKHPAGLDFAIYAYVRDGNQINARMFAPLDEIPEDPATGSAAATLAALLTEILDTPQNLMIHQGVAMGRPSLITAATTNARPAPVTISGTAVRVMEGRLVS
jgi:trans-2,3-dihydro-3-hydroxyanthranilate isomerase